MHPFPAWIKLLLALEGLSFKETRPDCKGQQGLSKGRVWTRFFRVLERPSATKDEENREKTAFRSLWSNSPVKKGPKKGLQGVPLAPCEDGGFGVFGKVDSTLLGFQSAPFSNKTS